MILKKKELKKDKLTLKEVFKETWKLYLPVVISTAVSIPCIITGNRVSNKRNMALAAVYTISETALQEYREKNKRSSWKKEKKVRKKFKKPYQKIRSKITKTVLQITMIGGDIL